MSDDLNLGQKSPSFSSQLKNWLLSHLSFYQALSLEELILLFETKDIGGWALKVTLDDLEAHLKLLEYDCLVVRTRPKGENLWRRISPPRFSPLLGGGRIPLVIYRYFYRPWFFLREKVQKYARISKGKLK